MPPGGAMSDLVMVIEDEKEIRDLLRYNLERAGFRVAPFADGEEGLEHLFEARPDVLVLDLMLPGRSGLELLRKVWGYNYLGETRTVDVHVRRLRIKIGEQHRVIETVPGVGYKLLARGAA